MTDQNQKIIELSAQDQKQDAALTEFPSPIDFDFQNQSSDVKIEKIAEHFEAIMKILGLDMTDSSLQKTPHRVARMYVNEVFSGLNPSTFPDIQLLDEKCTDPEHGEIILTKARFVSFCEHHFVPMVGEVYVGYIPNGKLVGLSKISRIVKYFSSRPQLQERLTAQIAASLSTVLETEHVAVTINAQHFCVLARGVRDESGSTTTSFLKGLFKTNQDFRKEFYNSVERMMHKKNIIE